MNNEQTNAKMLEVISKFNSLAEEVKDLRDYIQSDEFIEDIDKQLLERMNEKI